MLNTIFLFYIDNKTISTISYIYIYMQEYDRKDARTTFHFHSESLQK